MKTLMQCLCRDEAMRVEEQRFRQSRFVPVRMGAVSASRHAVGADMVAHGDARDPEQVGGRPQRRALQLSLLGQLPTGELSRSRRPQPGSVEGSVGRRSAVGPIGGHVRQVATGTPTGDDALAVWMAGQFGPDRAQPAGQWRGQVRRDRRAVVADRAVPIRSLHRVDSRACAAGPLQVGAAACASGT